ncbi:glycosyltransferase [Mycobacterium montefiorense]|uniref:glycosyltransferase n=2 Tax=Mycobacterium montefiorense TaxID=154654 RepID=UPI0021C499FF|nr:glycosyltransferase family A protein [Mycobacterium montefiorense]
MTAAKSAARLTVAPRPRCSRRAGAVPAMADRRRCPSVAIVIPAYNEERFIGRCLEACLNQTSRPDEIIVVNNRSTDGTASIVRRYQAGQPRTDIRLIDQNEVQGIAPTRNRGFDDARSDVIGRIDADSVIASDWVQTIRGRFRDPVIDAATGPVIYYDMPMRGLFLRIDRTVRAWLQFSCKDQRFLLGANMAIRASAWRAVRQLTRLDPEDLLHEDIDLAVTLFKNDFEVAYEPTLVAGMSGRRVECLPREFYRYATRYTRTIRAHGVKSGPARLTVAILLLGYFPARMLRFCYDVDKLRFTTTKLRATLGELTSRAGRDARAQVFKLGGTDPAARPVAPLRDRAA